MVIDYIVLVIDYTVLVIDYRVMVIDYRVLVIAYRVMVIDYIVLVIDYTVLIIDYRVLVIDYTVLNFEEKREMRAFQEQGALGLILELEKRVNMNDKKEDVEKESVNLRKMEKLTLRGVATSARVYVATLRPEFTRHLTLRGVATSARVYVATLRPEVEIGSLHYASPNDARPNHLIQSVIPALVSEEDNLMLINQPSREEIKSAVFNMKGDGAPGPDGFGGCFYQICWDVVGEDVCNFVSQFFRESWLLPNLNSNNVVLIPKQPGVDKIEEFRPIALANFQFKIITKILASRLAVVAPKIVSHQQRGFLKDRHIHDCICLASEAANLLDHKTFGENLGIKLDIKKAFNTIDWIFLQDTLTCFGFNSKFVILHSAKLSINVNGESVGFFHCLWGLRMSSVEEFQNMHVAEGKLNPISGPSGLKTPSHVLYADDILIFCKGLKSNLLALKSLIHDYATASGQHVNLAKCKFYTSSKDARRIQKLSEILGFNAGSLPFNYLGVPLFKGKPGRIHLQPIVDRIIAKLATWKGLSLSIMGMVELVKSVIHSMLAFSFHIYAWPASLIKILDSSIMNFIWSGNSRTRKLGTVAWKTVSTPIKTGGLGLRSLKHMNQAALLKLAWEMISSEQDWALFVETDLAMTRPCLRDTSSLPYGLESSLTGIL
ncbi:hypothetical protein Lal_00036473 [Lupinus albus]|nr:hypothetical protein Lal_00036473 [Lupinus albus]